MNYLSGYLVSAFLFIIFSLNSLRTFAGEDYDYSNTEFETQINNLLQETDRLYNAANNDYVIALQDLIALKLNGSISDKDKNEIDNYSDNCTTHANSIHSEYEKIDNTYKEKVEEIYRQRVKIREECERGILDNPSNSMEIYNNWLIQKQQINEQQLNAVNLRNNNIKTLITQFETLTKDIRQKIASFNSSTIQTIEIIDNNSASIYSIDGTLYKTDLKQLPQGIYIINKEKVYIK